MPLHLLPKKSWNVYSPANIERVRRDEAEAQRQEIEKEKRERQDEADERLQILQGKRDGKELKKKRKLPGEDDTDRDIRLALETRSATTSATHADKRPRPSKESEDVSLVDAKGHFSLIQGVPEPQPQQKPRPEDDQYTVYLSHATGRDRGKEGESPWYTTSSSQGWGDGPTRQKQREFARLAASDPLAAMKKGVKALRQNERQKQDWMAQRERDLREVEDLARERRRMRREKRGGSKDGHLQDHGDDEDLDSLDGFNLDEGFSKDRTHKERLHEPGHHHRHRHHRHRHRHGDDKDEKAPRSPRDDHSRRRRDDPSRDRDGDRDRPRPARGSEDDGKEKRHRKHRRDHQHSHSHSHSHHSKRKTSPPETPKGP